MRLLSALHPSGIRHSSFVVPSVARLAAFLILGLSAVIPAAFAVDAPLPRVVVLGTGGTIQSKGATRMVRHDYKAGKYEINELLALIPEVNKIARVEATQVTNIGSPSMTPEVWKQLADKINKMAYEQPDIAGFVLTHGTNTLEETAFFLHLTVRTDKPVLVVGAQRPSTSISADGLQNLYQAVQAAIAPDSRNRGVMICMNQYLVSAREGSKTSAYKVEAFTARDLGALGVVDPDGVHYYRKPFRRHTVMSEFDIEKITKFPRVDVVDSYAAAPRDMVDFLVGKGAKGIVLSGHGAGGSSPGQADAFAEAIKKGVAVVNASRTGSGRVIATAKNLEVGIVPGDNLLPHKARILLMLALASGKSSEAELTRIFDQY
jgi:L-asparaginase